MQSDHHVDDCTACGGSGTLVMCDGCENAFHYRCCDPPLAKKDMDKAYFCNECQAAGRDPAHSGQDKVLEPMIDKIASTNSASFQLPLKVRDFYEGVGTKRFGEYEDTSAPRVQV